MSRTIRENEELAKRALLLKRKELKLKLMQASQIQNRAQLEEIRLEANYNKRKMLKIAALANKLRAKYVKVAKAARNAESQYKKLEEQLLMQEKFVADEKMQLTKLAVDCRTVGAELYGSEYQITIYPTKDKDRRRAPISRLSSLYDTKDSVLRNLASYRLTSKFSETALPLTDLNYAHMICPHHCVCLPDLIDTCTDKNCIYQHKSNYLMSDIDKLADILSYKPSLTGFKPDPALKPEENDHYCRVKLKQYAARLLAKNSDKPVETIAQNLVKYIRSNKSDHDILTMTRKLPKFSHLMCVHTDEDEMEKKD